ncbi:aminopeptidase P family protein [Bacteroidales bacterium OttesenSCG-928-C19]|nr:aminopeptidase P family protein [Bacteroidales bacterium OttesenSCG-928-C19]
MFTKETYIKRREQLRKDVKSGLIIIQGNSEVKFNYPANTYSFRQDSTFLYFFGLNQPDLIGVLDCETGKDWIFGNDFDIDDIIWMGDLPTIKELGASVGVENTAPLKDLNAVVKDALSKKKPVHFLPPYRGENLIQMSELLGINYSEVTAKASMELIKACVKQRSIKSVEEIAEIEKAVNTAYLMHTTVMKMAMPGRYEYELAGTAEGIALAGGGPVSFPVILSINGQTLHNHYHGNKLSVGRMLVMDAGCENEMNYCSDITRSTPVGGKFDERQRSIYEIVLNANLEAQKHIKAGITYREVHLKACTVLASGLKDLGILKGNVEDIVSNGAHALFMPHGLGHMMGLDVHDMENYGENNVGYDDEIKRSTQFGLGSLRLGRRLESGFVITNEPGCYFIPALIDKWRNEKINTDFVNFDVADKYKDFGGIRIEDDILVTENGCRVLGKPIPKTVAEVEATMQQ